MKTEVRFLEEKSKCDKCKLELAVDGRAYICNHECTICESFTRQTDFICPNRGGELVQQHILKKIEYSRLLVVLMAILWMPLLIKNGFCDESTVAFPNKFVSLGPKLKWSIPEGSNLKLGSIGFEVSYWEDIFSPISLSVEYLHKIKALHIGYQIQGGFGAGVSVGPFYEIKFQEENRFGVVYSLWTTAILGAELGYKEFFEGENLIEYGGMLKMPVSSSY